MVAGAVLLLLAVSGALAATLVSDDGGDSSPRRSALPSFTRTPAAHRSALDELPIALKARIEALPERLREQVLRAVEEGRLALSALEDLLRQYEMRNSSVRVGQVLEASDTKLMLEVLSTGELAVVAIDDKTVLRRATDVIKGSDLKRNELVMMLSMDGGKTAFSVTAFGVSPF